MTITAIDMVERFEHAAAKLDELEAQLDTIALEAGRELLATTTHDERRHREFTEGVLDGASDDGVHAHISERSDRDAIWLYLAGYAYGHDAYSR